MSTRPWAGHGYKYHIHLETAIGDERFITLHLIQSSPPLQELPHAEIRRLVGMGKTMSSDRKIDKMMSWPLLSLEFGLDSIM